MLTWKALPFKKQLINWSHSVKTLFAKLFNLLPELWAWIKGPHCLITVNGNIAERGRGRKLEEEEEPIYQIYQMKLGQLWLITWSTKVWPWGRQRVLPNLSCFIAVPVIRVFTNENRYVNIGVIPTYLQFSSVVLHCNRAPTDNCIIRYATSEPQY